ncbi:chemotaxis protein CheW [Candidatus Woesearchaeota archaeon]|nr:MAG: chemotaxis protein CheW [Candidatus Woesearchaeota archaeon]
MAENQLIIFKLGEEEFGVSIQDVREIITVPEITKIPDVEDYVLGIINLRDKIISIIDIEKKLKLLPDMNTKEKRIIIVDIQGEEIGILVDSCNQVLHLDKKNIDDAPETIVKKIGANFIKGVGKVQERLIILLDMEKLLGDHIVKTIPNNKTTTKEKVSKKAKKSDKK